jgi:hypothetical protein
MEAYQLNRLVSKPDLLTESDGVELDRLSKEFPYFQAVRALKACLTRSESDIHKAAAYTADRSVLAALIGSEDFQIDTQEPPMLQTETLNAIEVLTGVKALDLPIDSEEQPQSAPISTQEPSAEPIESLEVHADQLQTLEFVPEPIEELSEPLSRQDTVEDIVYPEPEILLYSEPEYPQFEEPQFEPEGRATEPIHSFESASEDFEPISSGESSVPAFDDLDFFEPKPTPPTTSASTGFALDALLSQSDKGFSDKIERQKKLIDKFISGHVVPPSEEEVQRAEQVEKKDLSEKSSHLSPEMATESLAKFFVKQGKIDIAREIYGFLMIKHPEKAAYFESLRSQL